jgi:predicted secreted protein
MRDTERPMIRRALLAGLMVVPTLVQPARAETMLHLAETATIMAPPDELAATLRAEAAATSASDAQDRVNATMQQALALARKVGSLTVSTGGYGVWRAAERWQVSQALNFSGHDGPALLSLVGVLQQHGLAVSSLGWRLSRAAEKQARQEATKQALVALHGRVDEAAALLGLRFDQFKQVRLDTTGQQPMFRTMAAPSSGSAPPPSVAPEDVPVSATAEADAVLLPR